MIARRKELRRSSPMPPQTKPMKRGTMRKRNPKRRESEFARCYHSKERVAWVKTLPCVVPGCDRTEIDNMHIKGDGGSRKGFFDWIVPACRYHHQQAHRIGIESFEDRYFLFLSEAAASTDEAWRRRQDVHD